MLGYKKTKTLDFDTALFLDEDIQWASIKNTYQGTQQYYNLLINLHIILLKKILIAVKT